MGRRPRTLILGLVVVVAALWSQRTAGSEPASARIVEGWVAAAGAAPAADGWTVAHPAPGIYRIELPGRDVVLDVPAWDVAADVTILPLERGAVEVRFARARTPVDTDFSFVARVRS